MAQAGSGPDLEQAVIQRELNQVDHRAAVVQDQRAATFLFVRPARSSRGPPGHADSVALRPRTSGALTYDFQAVHCLAKLSVSRAGVTQLAECQLPKLNVAGSNPVSRSTPLHRWSIGEARSWRPRSVPLSG